METTRLNRWGNNLEVLARDGYARTFANRTQATRAAEQLAPVASEYGVRLRVAQPRLGPTFYVAVDRV